MRKDAAFDALDAAESVPTCGCGAARDDAAEVLTLAGVHLPLCGTCAAALAADRSAFLLKVALGLAARGVALPADAD